MISVCGDGGGGGDGTRWYVTVTVTVTVTVLIKITWGWQCCKNNKHVNYILSVKYLSFLILFFFFT